MIISIYNLINLKTNITTIIVLLQSILVIETYVKSLSEQIGWLNSHLVFFEKYFEYKQEISKLSFVNENLNTNIFKDGINELEIKNCCFSYNMENQIFKNLNLKLKKGDIIALVGSNGSGKSTLVKIILGLYELQKGYLLVNNNILQQKDLTYFWDKSCVIFQNYAKYKFTMYENIFFNRTENDLYTNNKNKIDINDFYKPSIQLGKDLNGEEISEGQWQKLAIHRLLAKYKTSEVIIMDEPTSSIDPIFEKKYYEFISSLPQDKIIIFVTHRLSSIKYSNRVIFLNKGQIIDDDNHHNLFKNNQEYRTFYKSQADNYFTTTNK